MTAVVDGLRSKLTVYGYSMEEGAAVKREASDTVLIRAPMSGYVADIQAHVGDKVDTASPLMTVADPRNIVIVANVYDTDVPKVKKNSRVTFLTDVFPNLRFKGLIAYVSDVSDPDLKTVKTFIRLLEGKEVFKQNMFLKLKIESEKRDAPGYTAVGDDL